MYTENMDRDARLEFDAQILGESAVVSPQHRPQPKSEGVGSLMAAFQIGKKG